MMSKENHRHKYDYSKLLGKIKEKGYTQEQFACALDMSDVTLNKRLKNRCEFKQSEIIMSLSLLNEPLSKIVDYFFTYNL